MSADDEGFTRLLEYVEDEIGFVTSYYNDSYLDRRITSRMRRTDSESYDSYLEILRSNPDEHDELLDSMSINVTGFFRNPEVWDGIRSVLRHLASEKENVYVWSAACADGREPYSLAMLALDDPMIDESSVHIVGTDISANALETARNGVYQSTRTIDLGEQLEYLDDYNQYVECEDNHYHVQDIVKQNVRLERHDLISGAPKSGFDLVVCRNLFIYIDNDYKQEILETIGQSLQSNGYLVIGKAETIPPMLKTDFSILESRLRIYQRESAESQQVVE